VISLIHHEIGPVNQPECLEGFIREHLEENWALSVRSGKWVALAELHPSHHHVRIRNKKAEVVFFDESKGYRSVPLRMAGYQAS